MHILNNNSISNYFFNYILKLTKETVSCNLKF